MAHTRSCAFYLQSTLSRLIVPIHAVVLQMIVFFIFNNINCQKIVTALLEYLNLVQCYFILREGETCAPLHRCH